MHLNRSTLGWIKQLAAFILIATSLSATGTTGLSDYYLKALQQDPDYAAARANYEAEIKSRDLAGVSFYPTLNMTAAADNAQYQRRDVGVKTTQFTGYDPLTVGIRLTQPLFSMDRIAFMAESEARAARAEWVLAQARQDLALRVVQTAFNYLLNLDQLALAKAQADAMKAQLTQLEGLLVSKTSTRTEVADARARHEIALVQIRQAQSQLEVRKLEFIKLTGQPPDANLLPLANNPVLQLPEPLDPQAWTDAARERGYKVLAQQASVKLAQAGISRAKAGLYPTVSLVASSQQAREPNYFTAADRTDTLSLQLNMNLFDGGSTRIQASQAVSQAERAQNELLSAQHDAAIGAGQAYWGVVNGIEQVRAMVQAVAAAELALEGTRMGIKANVKTYADELNAVQLLYATRRDLQKERYTFLLSRVQLMSAPGMTQDDMAAMLRGLL